LYSQWSAIALVIGDFSTVFIRLPLLPSVIAFTVFCGIIYIACIPVPESLYDSYFDFDDDYNYDDDAVSVTNSTNLNSTTLLMYRALGAVLSSPLSSGNSFSVDNPTGLTNEYVARYGAMNAHTYRRSLSESSISTTIGDFLWTYTPIYPFVLVICMFGIRFLDAHLLTSIYRALATDFDVEDRGDVTRAVGVVDQTCTTLGAIISTLIVLELTEC
jgi:hypothetical protein